MIELRDGYWSWSTGEDMSVTPNFSLAEFECPGCDTHTISMELISKLQLLRDIHKRPIRITSGYRSPEYQDDLKRRGYKTAKNSQHVLGNAVDIVSRDLEQLHKDAQRIFIAIGKANSFVHVDIRMDKVRRWSY